MSEDKRATASDTLVVGVAQIAPVWLNRDATIEKVVEWIRQAADAGCQLVAFGEALVPGYPFWLAKTDGARFESAMQKEIHAHYLLQGVSIEAGHLDPVTTVAADLGIAVMLGCVERADDRGGHSLYCSLVYIDAAGRIQSVHRKLMPTYEERLCWGIGDGNGLRVHDLSPFRVGGLNCWENWMPLTRAALHGQGEDLHVAVWPGAVRLTQDITRFVAREGRSFVISACGLLRKSDIDSDLPHSDAIRQASSDMIADGGSCIAGPDGQWVVEPVANEEKLIVATLDHEIVRQERQNFDPAGHYSRPDVTQLLVNRERQSGVIWDGDDDFRRQR